MKPIKHVSPIELGTLALTRRPIGMTLHFEEADYTTLPPMTSAEKVAACDNMISIKKALPDKIEVVRFYRPAKADGHPDPKVGMTVIYELDYVQRHIVAFFSICDGEDLFNKHDGLRIARNRQSKRLGLLLPLALQQGPSLMQQLILSANYMERSNVVWATRILNTAFEQNGRDAMLNHVAAVRRFILKHFASRS